MAATGVLTLEELTLAGGWTGGSFTGLGCCGGGLLNQGGTVVLINVILTGNAAAAGGGGLYTVGGTVRIARTDFIENVGGYGIGGGLAADGGSVTIVQTAFVGNWSYIGGGFGLYGGGTMTMMNSTIAHNSAGKGGGGYLLGATTRLVNVTVADNRSHGVDGIIGGMELQNTILARNLSYSGYYGVDCTGFTSLGNNLLGDLTGCAGTPLLSDVIGEPGLADFINNEQPGHGQIPLLPMSRAIGAGNDATCPKKDQLGENRVGVCDIGAIEFQGTAVSSR